MTILDGRGRLFGRLNLIDVLAVLLILAVVPLTYRAWGLFRTPSPVIERVTPSVVEAGKANQHVDVYGRDFRPYLRAGIDKLGARFLFDSTTHASVELPSLAPGTYELTLFDDAKDIFRFPNAVTAKAPVAVKSAVITTVTPSVLADNREPKRRVELRGRHFRPSLRVVIGDVPGEYAYESPERAHVVVPPLGPGRHDVALFDGDTEVARYPNAITGAGPVVDRLTPRVWNASRDPQRVELMGRRFQQNLRVFIGWREVTRTIDSAERAQIEVPPLPVGTYDLILFDEAKELFRYPRALTIQPAELAELKILVRFVVRPEVLTLIKRTPADPPSAGARGAVLVSYDVVQEKELLTTSGDLHEGLVSIVHGTVRLSAVKKQAAGHVVEVLGRQLPQDGWMFEDQPIRAGAPFTLNARNYVLKGDILRVDVVGAGKR